MDGAFYDALALPARWERTAYLAGKRFVDLAVSAAGLLLLAPLFLLIAAAVRLDSPGPAFFLHERVGMGGKPLRVWKFRTMARNARELAERFTPASGGSSSGASSSRTTRASPGWAPSCGGRAWTSCPSSSTCCAGR